MVKSTPMRSSYMRRLCGVVLAAGALAARAQVPAEPGVLPWRTGAARIAAQTPAEILAASAAVQRGGRARHAILQFKGPVTPSVRAALQEDGVRTLRYLGNHAYFVGLEPGAQPGAAQQTAIRALVPIEPAWKLHPDLLHGQPPAWSRAPEDKAPHADDVRGAVTPTERVAIYVLLHPDEPLGETAARIVREHEGYIRSALHSINALVVELPWSAVLQLAADDAVQWLEPPLPPLAETNLENRALTGIEAVQEAPYNLSGAGVAVLVYDSGSVLASHPDLLGRVTNGDTSPGLSHPTHVAGTVGGSGVSSGGTYRGMAPGVTILSYGFQQAGGYQAGFLYTDPGDIEADYAAAIGAGAALANNSIGTNTAANGFPCDWEGDYGVTNVLIDTIVRGDGGNPLFSDSFRVIWANGNERGSGRCGNGYHTTAPPACGKNQICVGAVNANDDSVTAFTSWGPTDDDRLKPDFVAPGCQNGGDNGVTSCINGGYYGVLCGTSMAAPTVTGLAALLLEDYRTRYPERSDLRNATLKALLAHTAEDLEAPGPDYQTGYGSVRVLPALAALREDRLVEAEVDGGATWRAVAIVPPGAALLQVTLAWDDVPATPNVSPALVNDLDLRVFDAAGVQYFPWTLGGLADPATPAVRTQPDRVNNIEQVRIDAAAPGTYRIEVIGHNVPAGPQPFALVATPGLVTCSSTGMAVFARAAFGCAASAEMQVIDCDLNTSDAVVDTVSVLVRSDLEPAGELVVLTETAAATAAFTGVVPLSETDAAGVLRVAEGGALELEYADADTGAGQPALVTDSAVIDCTPPGITSVAVDEVHARDAVLTIVTDEPTRVAVHYGTACAALTDVWRAEGYAGQSTAVLRELVESTAYYLRVEVEDAAGNVTTDDAGGACYAFATPALPRYFTQQFGADNDLDYLRILFTPDGSSDGYTACTELLSALPSDPDGGAALAFTDDSVVELAPAGVTFTLYGVAYPKCYVSANGFITFVRGDTAWNENLVHHFTLPRIAALFDDLSPQLGAVSWKQWSDRIAVTFEDVPEFNTENSNTFQFELFHDGRIALSYLNVDVQDGLVGLSAGLGPPAYFSAADLSAEPACGAYPPVATGQTVYTEANVPVDVELTARDDGLPDPPAALAFVIVALAEHGTLRDPAGGVIGAELLPYSLASGGAGVTYTPHPYYTGADAFSFQATDGGAPPEGGSSNTAEVELIVGGQQPQHRFPLDSDPGWTTEGAWAFGLPQGAGSHNRDPVAGYTGANVCGYNLAGDYANDMAVQFLTAGPFDCTGLTQTELRFRRWLGIEHAAYDQARVDISTNGADWTTIWNHSGSAINESGWTLRSYGLSPYGDGAETLYVRWGMGPTDSVTTYPGWNLDDIEIWGTRAVDGAADLNCDLLVDFRDINVFVLAMANPETYAARYPECPFANRDINGDGVFDFRDINPFVARLAQP